MRSDLEYAGVNLDRRKICLGLAFAAAVGVGAARQPDTPVNYLGKKKLDDVVPKAVGPWQFVTASGLIVPPDDQLADLTYSNVLTRVYADGNNPSLMFLVAQSDGQTGVIQVHRPEACYPAMGFTLSPIIQRRVSTQNGSFVANELTATADDRQEHILYWTRVGDHMPVSWAEQRLVIARDNIAGLIPDAALVRVSMVSTNRAEAIAVMEQFIRTLLQTMQPAARRVLVA
jgi:EpsI family protein